MTPKRPHVACVGVAVIDAIFRVDQLPNGSDKVHATEYMEVAGGVAANGARAIARLGGAASLASRVGDDRLAQMLSDEFAADGVDISGIERILGLRTPFSCVSVDRNGERQLVNDTDPRLFTTAGGLTEAAFAQTDAVLVDVRWVPAAALALRCAKQRGIPGVIDVDIEPDDAMLELLRLSSHAIFSRQGLRGLTGETDVERGLALARNFTSAWIAVTAGHEGVFWPGAEDGGLNRMPVFPVTAIDTLAAGDVFHGAFALGLAEGQTIEGALRLASAAAALKCTKFGGGAAAPYRAEVDALLAG